MRRLIEAGADCSVVRDSQWNILHYAAIGGSVDTLRSLVEADLSSIDLQEWRTKDTCQSVTDMLNARLEALEDNPAKREVWKLAWDALMDGFKPNVVRTLARPGTTYFDAKDQPFEQGQEE